jgi:uncharacterized protein (DUF2147 family)
VIRRVLAAVLIGAAAGPVTAAPVPVTGRWLTPERDAMVEVGPCGAKLCGRITRILKPNPNRPSTDRNNPDPALRNRPIQGLAILSGFTAEGDRWKGRIYDPRNGRDYRSELVREGNILKVKGCLGPFCRTQEWTRAN